MDDSIRRLTEQAESHMKTVEKIRTEFEKVIVGQDKLMNRMLNALLSGGHLLLEGVPGLAKTLAIQTLSSILGVDFKRIQFTPDMLPADIRGTMIYKQNTGEFEIKRGPIFSNFILADEINRAPSKVQSALLESMQERTVTLGDTTHALPAPFFVMATQNPIEQEGTYPLPEAQTDRFFMKLRLNYPTLEEEKRIIRRMGTQTAPKAKAVVSREEVLALQSFAEQIYVDDRIVDYIADLVHATRDDDQGHVRYGASPRASIAFVRAVRAEAFFDGRGYVIPEDVKAVAHDILRHRIILSFEAEAEGLTPETWIDELLKRVAIP